GAYPNHQGAWPNKRWAWFSGSGRGFEAPPPIFGDSPLASAPAATPKSPKKPRGGGGGEGGPPKIWDPPNGRRSSRGSPHAAAPKSPQTPPKTPPLPPPPRNFAAAPEAPLGFGGGGNPQILGETPTNPQIRAGKSPKFGIGTGLRAEPPLPFLGGGGILGVPPAPILGSPNLGVPPEPPLAAAIAAATRQDEDGDTPLHIAVAQGAVTVARRLVSLFLRGGRDLDVYNHLRQTPLHLAVITGQVSLVRLLLSHGASAMAPDRLGRTCAHLACGSHLWGGGASAPGGGACAGPRPRVLRELLRGPAPPPDLQARDYEGRK
uniref:Uncharacterized protein n=1 Tax=Taeniopygia guttata TaxID=59729 RepID=A0A674GFI1_TAEGU